MDSNSDSTGVVIKVPISDIKNIDFNQLTSRDFEELIYEIFDEKIRDKKYLGIYDSIYLLNGVSDKGRDCNLCYSGHQIGLIQCKKYKSPLTPKAINEEVLKFILWSCINHNIFKCYKNRKFHYILATTNGITNASIDSITNYGSKINRSEIDKTCKRIIAKYSKLKKSIDYKNIKNEVYKKIVQVKVSHYSRNDITNDLSQYMHILHRFFLIPRVVDNSALKPIEKGIEEIKEKIENSHSFSDDKIIKDFKNSSFVFDDVIDSFFDVGKKIHIEREITENVLSWIQKDDIKKIGLVVGDAGCGKSVVLKDIKNHCEKLNIPVLAIKAEYRKSKDIITLFKNMGFSIIDYVRTITLTHKVVIIIDQIDALSQNFSATREYINVYIDLISQLLGIENAKIIISTRTFDLKNDSDIGNLEKFSTKFNITRLSENELNQVLKQISCNEELLSRHLKEILKTPVYLSIFCKIFSTRNKYININSVYELYNNLWDKYINHCEASTTDTENVKKLLETITLDMNKNNEIIVFARKYKESDIAAFNFLCDEHIIDLNGNQIQMFHQTFYDFSFAITFIKNGGDVFKYLKINKQSILIRATFKMVLSFLREYNHSTYIETITEIVNGGTNNEYKYHIKDLVISILANESSPTQDEKNLFLSHIIKSKQYTKLFFAKCTSTNWFLFILDIYHTSNLLNKESDVIQEALYLISRFCGDNQGAVIECISQHRDLPIFSDLNVYNLLYAFPSWNDELIQLLEYSTSVSIWNEKHVRLLTNIAESNSNYVCKILKSQITRFLMDIEGYKKINGESYYYEELLKKVYEKDANELFQILSTALNNLIAPYDSSSSENEITHDSLTHDYHYNGISNYGSITSLCIDLCIDHLIKLSDNDPDIFEPLLMGYLTSKKMIWLYASATAIDETKSSRKNLWFKLFLERINQLKGFSSSNPIGEKIQHILACSFDNFSESEKLVIANILINIDLQWEHKCYNFSEKEIEFCHIGYTAFYFLKGINSTFWEKHRDIGIRFDQLKRRWGNQRYFKEFNNATHCIHTIASISPSKYIKISPNNWIRLLIQHSYSNRNNQAPINTSTNFDEQISINFKEAVTKNSSKMCKVLEAIIHTFSVDIEYKVNGICGLIESGNCPQQASEMLKQLFSLYKLEDIYYQSLNEILWAILKHNKGIVIDHYIYSKLIKIAETNRQNSNGDGSINAAYNNPQGIACICLELLYNSQQSNTDIFKVLGSIAETCPENVKCAMLWREANLININKEKAFILFQQLVNNVDNNISIAAIWTCQYYEKEYTLQLLPFYKKIILLDIKNEELKGYSYFIAKGFISGVQGYGKLIDYMIANKAETITYILDIALYHYKNKTCKKNCIALVDAILSSTSQNNSKDICEAFEMSLLRSKKERMDLSIYKPIISKYIDSPAFNDGCHYHTFEYLHEQCTMYPHQVLDILHSIDIPKIMNNGTGAWLAQEEKLQVLIIFLINCLKINDQYCVVATDILDTIMENSRGHKSFMQKIEEM